MKSCLKSEIASDSTKDMSVDIWSSVYGQLSSSAVNKISFSDISSETGSEFFSTSFYLYIIRPERRRSRVVRAAWLWLWCRVAGRL